MKYKHLNFENNFKNKSIALVGNSSKLLTSNSNNSIDKHDIVIRFNFSKIIPKFTGKKTSFRWIRCPINENSIKIHHISENINFNNYMFKFIKTNNIICSSATKSKLLKIHSSNNIFSYDKFKNLVSVNLFLKQHNIPFKFNVIENSYPRTGFLAILAMIDISIKPHIYGYDLEKEKYMGHYDGNNYIVDNIIYHQIHTEIDIINYLSDNNLIIVH